MSKSRKISKFYTILILPDQGSRSRKILIPSPWVRLFPLLGSLCVVAFLTFSTLFIYFSVGFLRHRHAGDELNQVQIKMDQVADYLDILEKDLDRVRAFDTKLRMITNLQDPARQLALGPLAANPLEEEFSESPFDEVIPYLHGEENPPTVDELLIQAKRLEETGLERESSLVDLLEGMRNQEFRLAVTPAIWPVAGHLTSRFGMRISPFTGTRKFHAGLDIGAPPGTVVRAPANGTVLFVGTKSGYGDTLILGHGFGIVTCFAHNSKVLVKVGEKIERGQEISLVGNTGRSTGPHLHYEVRFNGKPQDPSLFILN